MSNAKEIADKLRELSAGVPFIWHKELIMREAIAYLDEQAKQSKRLVLLEQVVDAARGVVEDGEICVEQLECCDSSDVYQLFSRSTNRLCVALANLGNIITNLDKINEKS